jgi:hypothetical protein
VACANFKKHSWKERLVMEKIIPVTQNKLQTQHPMFCCPFWTLPNHLNVNRRRTWSTFVPFSLHFQFSRSHRVDDMMKNKSWASRCDKCLYYDNAPWSWRLTKMRRQWWGIMHLLRCCRVFGIWFQILCFIFLFYSVCEEFY